MVRGAVAQPRWQGGEIVAAVDQLVVMMDVSRERKLSERERE